MAFGKRPPEKNGWKKFDPAQLPPVPKYVPRADIPKPAVPSDPPDKVLPKLGQRDKEKESEHFDPEKEFLTEFQQLAGQHHAWDIFNDFVTLFATSISNAVDKSHFREREDLYLQTIQKYDSNEQQIFVHLAAYTVMGLEKNPEQDFLGNIFMRLNLGSNTRGQIFTPYHICELMAEITMQDLADAVKKLGYITVDDPCCGGGATLIAAVNKARRDLAKVGLNFQNHILITGQDIDQTVLLMCYIQISLLGVAGYFKLGNSLLEPMTVGDTMNNYWFTPMYFSDDWFTRRQIRAMEELIKNGQTYENNG